MPVNGWKCIRLVLLDHQFGIETDRAPRIVVSLPNLAEFQTSPTAHPVVLKTAPKEPYPDLLGLDLPGSLLSYLTVEFGEYYKGF